jgi:hypothetical protein
MVPTPFALQLAEPVDYAPGTIQSALNQQTSFDPATRTRTIIMPVSDIGEIYFVKRFERTMVLHLSGFPLYCARRNSDLFKRVSRCFDDF